MRRSTAGAQPQPIWTPTVQARRARLRSSGWRTIESTSTAARTPTVRQRAAPRSEEHTSELQSHSDLVCRLLLEKTNAPDARDDLPGPQHSGAVDARGDLAGVREAGACVSRTGVFFNDTATTEIYTRSLHDALPISTAGSARHRAPRYARRHDRGRRSGRSARTR